jgi:hypothetical protein
MQELSTDEDAALADAQDNDPLINIGWPAAGSVDTRLS